MRSFSWDCETLGSRKSRGVPPDVPPQPEKDLTNQRDIVVRSYSWDSGALGSRKGRGGPPDVPPQPEEDQIN
jgi:hypothetical protein